MFKNIASQKIGCQLTTIADGTEFTGSVTVYVTGDAGTQAAGSVGSGACTHEGHGYHTYAPAQAETNYDLIAFTFVGTGAKTETVQLYTGVDAVKVAGATPQTLTDFWAQAMSDLAAPPAANASVLAGINWIFQLARNKVTQTATQQKIYKDDASTVAGTATVSDDGTTFTRGEFA